MRADRIAFCRYLWREWTPGKVLAKYIITEMYAKAAQGMSAGDAVKWAEGELKKIYET